ncbi:MAG: carbon-monoxide dehydrogenase medium subunit, partial [Myxococcota bacterium]
AGELVTEVLIAPRAAHSGSRFIKYAKTAVDFALVNAAAEITLDGNTVTAVRAAVGAIHTPPIRVTDAEQLVLGSTLDAATLAAAAASVAKQVAPRRDARATDDYLRHSAGVVVRRCLEGAAARARGEAHE